MTVFFKLFDIKIAPILFYGAELWGTKMYDSLEYVHRYACKRLINVNSMYVTVLPWVIVDVSHYIINTIVVQQT